MLDETGEDTFRSVLGAQALRVRVSDSYTFCGHWEDLEPEVDHGVFHLVDHGACWVRIRGLPEPERLLPGDLLMFPHGATHTLCSNPALTDPTPQNSAATLLCCDFHFADGRRNPLLDALPDYLIVREADGGERFRRLAQLVSQEIHGKAFGSRVVLDKLADAMFTMALRHYVEYATERRRLIAALADTRLARALAAMHAEPGRNWTVAALAGIALQSRTVFAQRFVDVMGTSPYQYLTDWRMSEAARLLGDPALSVATVAERLGYRTESAFRRAFKKNSGQGPGQVRRAARAGRRAAPA